MITKKLVLVGKYGVGKTSLVSRFVDNKFSDQYLSTIGVSIMQKNIPINSVSMKLMIWDIAGEQTLDKVPQSYLRGASGVIYVVDLTRPASYNDLSKELELVYSINNDIPFVFGLNKADLAHKDQHRQCLHHLPKHMPVVTTSAKSGKNVYSLFENLAEKMLINIQHCNVQ